VEKGLGRRSLKSDIATREVTEVNKTMRRPFFDKGKKRGSWKEKVVRIGESGAGVGNEVSRGNRE